MRDLAAMSIEERLRYTAARFAFRHRWELCPAHVEVNGVVQAITWATWFHLRFGVTLDEYQHQLTENDACT